MATFLRIIKNHKIAGYQTITLDPYCAYQTFVSEILHIGSNLHIRDIKHILCLAIWAMGISGYRV
jgi:hypothetical protein